MDDRPVFKSRIASPTSTNPAPKTFNPTPFRIPRPGGWQNNMRKTMRMINDYTRHVLSLEQLHNIVFD